MSDTIRRLANGSSYTVLQEKLDNLRRNYNLNTCDSNLGRICELIELTSKVQGQLFTAMSLTASEGGTYGGVDTLKSRLLPWLGSGFTASSAGVTSDTSLSLLQESVEKDRKIAQLEAELRLSKDDLDNTVDNLRLSREESKKYKRQVDELGDFERQVRFLRDEISNLRGEKEILQNSLRRARSVSPSRARSPSPSRRIPPSPLISPTHAELTNSIRHSRLVARFNDLYAIDRLDMQDRLRRFVDDDEMVKRILFIATCESFHVAKMAYRSFRLRARRLLSPIHTGPGELEDAVNDYIVRNLDLHDLESSVDSVIRSMNVNPKISFPPECDFSLLSPFIREVCRVAYAMQALEPPLDVPLATDGELFSDAKYRRSYDSEYSAPLVAYHIWPTLMEGDCPLIKGEACTRRGALSSPRRSRSPSPLRSSSRLSRSSLSRDRGRSTSRGRY
uniref:mitochondria-eating protein-like isoform X2 n=1 Tax=Styela clava TaxID=7725 RepID=UPI001939E02A|nr:mitochondria-eating protein-like isoform X2 [Styela clava]